MIDEKTVKRIINFEKFLAHQNVDFGNCDYDIWITYCDALTGISNLVRRVEEMNDEK